MSVKYESFSQSFNIISIKNNVKLGTSQPKLYLGNTQVKATYLGDTLLIGSEIDSSYTLTLSVGGTENNLSYIIKNTEYLADIPYRDYFHYNESRERWELITYYYNLSCDYYEHPCVAWDDYSGNNIRAIYKNYCLSSTITSDFRYDHKETSALLSVQLSKNGIAQTRTSFNANYTYIIGTNDVSYFFVEPSTSRPVNVTQFDFENNLPLQYTYEYNPTLRNYFRNFKIINYDKNAVNSNASGFGSMENYINFNIPNYLDFNLYFCTYHVSQTFSTLPPINDIYVSVTFSFVLPETINHNVRVAIQYGTALINDSNKVFTPSYDNIGWNWGFYFSLLVDKNTAFGTDLEQYRNTQNSTLLNNIKNNLSFKFYTDEVISNPNLNGIINLLNLSIISKEYTGLHEFIITTDDI